MPKLYRRARVRAFQALFEAEFGRLSAPDALSRDLERASLPAAEAAYAQILIRGVADNLSAIDAVITETAPAWPVDQIAVVDRSVLRIALYELLFNNAAVPVAAAINEAVELAKTYGNDSGRRFVNGVLGAVSRERQLVPAAPAAVGQHETEEPGEPV